MSEMGEMLPVTQADRDAATAWTSQHTIARGRAPISLVQAFARHRLAHSAVAAGKVNCQAPGCQNITDRGICDTCDQWVDEQVAGLSANSGGSEPEETSLQEVYDRLLAGTFYDDYDWAAGPGLRAVKTALAASPSQARASADLS